MGQLGATEGGGWKYGAFLALYVLLQTMFWPILGGLSDRFGRRPILLVSLAGAFVDNLGRAIAGATGASMAVASAYVADVTPSEHRSRRSGQLSAAFGVGFIAGPALGGFLGIISPRAPFLAAAALNAANLVLAALTVRESHLDRSQSNGRGNWAPWRR
jgi:DHA1 family tetracycline resistance protein-like MFS transporter